MQDEKLYSIRSMSVRSDLAEGNDQDHRDDVEQPKGECAKVYQSSKILHHDHHH